MWPTPLTPPPGAAAHAAEVARALSAKARELALVAAAAAAPPVLYADEHLCAVAKPAGRYCEAVCEAVPGHTWLAHRLDRDTSGVLLLTRRPSLPKLAHAFASGAVTKRYLALTAGPPAGGWAPWGDSGELRVTCGHGRSAGGLWRAYAAEDVGAALPSGGGTVKATTTALTRLSAAGDGPALLLAAPEQGRTHQIRLAAQLAGAPLAGDVRYGGACVPAGDVETHCLHAALLALSHPVFGTPLVIAAPLPGWVDACGPDARARAEAVLVAWC